jgi:hypothetical protein
MRATPAALALLTLAACGNTDGGALVRAARAPFQPPEPIALADRERRATEGEEASAAEPSLELALGRRRATATLLQRQGDSRLWRAPGGVVVATDGARVVGTAGLAQMITGTRFDGPDPLADPAPLLRRSAEARRLVDLSPRGRDPAGMRFGVAFDCRLRASETEEANILLVQERCRAAGLGEVRNRFWVDSRTGRATHAEQWIGPGLPPLLLEFPD